MRKSRYSRNNTQSDLSEYISSTSSSVRIPNKIPNPSHERITCMPPNTKSRIHSSKKSQKVDRRRASVYHDLVETSCIQTQKKQKYFEDK